MHDENRNDLQNEQVAEFQYGRHLAALGVTQVSTNITPKRRKDHYDFEIYEEGKWTGVAEVRAVNYTHEQVQEWGGFMLEEGKLKALKDQFCFRSAVTGKPMWSKQIIFLFRCVPDDTLWCIHMRQIVDGWADWPEVSPEKFKTNHGAGQHPTKRGKRIPFNLMERVE